MPPPKTASGKKAAAKTNGNGDTPLMKQYRDVKARHPDAILLFRLGDFYELFHEDAKKSAPLLEVVLTQRQGTPMCGIPYHALSGYLAKLMKHGVRVAIAEQLDNPATTKGMVRRDVVRVVTPGTLVEDELLQAKDNNFLMAAYPQVQKKVVTGWGVAALDMSTGEFLLTTFANDSSGKKLQDEITRLAPKEILSPPTHSIPIQSGPMTTFLEENHFNAVHAEKNLKNVLGLSTLGSLGLNEDHPCLPCVGAILHYVQKNQPEALENIQPPRIYQSEDYLALDDIAIRHLDLLPETGLFQQKNASLWEVLDHTATSMGGRKLKWWMLHPLRDLPLIQERQEGVQFFLDTPATRKELMALLGEISDVERVLGRLVTGGASGRDLSALRRTVRQLPKLKSVLKEKSSLLQDSHPLIRHLADLHAPPALESLLEKSLADDPPLKLSDGGVIRDGYDKDLDELRALAKSGRSWISTTEASLRKETGINALKVGYTSVFGYYIEVSRANAGKVPPEWIRKQTLTNAERFITQELKEMEGKILGAEEKAKALEVKLFSQVRGKVLEYKDTLRTLSDSIAQLDALASLAETAERGAYVRPVFHQDYRLHFENARHPVVERALRENPDANTAFVPNSTLLDGMDNQILLITGPNMAGKSTYLRQVALLVILAQMGSFVPADKAELGLVDRVFTRIGAGDNLAAGASTFLVEMQEVANILHHATPHSLIILDEVGRGTSTYDGVAVAWAVIEHLHRAEKMRGPKVLFATHYFELTDLPKRLKGLKNYHAAAKEWSRSDGKTELVFLHQIVPGPADRSYGVHVAEMAGLPSVCVQRAQAILDALEKDTLPKSSRLKEAAHTYNAAPTHQLDLFGSHPVIKELSEVDVNTLTPLRALQLIQHLKDQIKENS